MSRSRKLGCLYAILVLAGLLLLGNVIWLVLINKMPLRRGVVPVMWAHIDSTVEDGSIL